MVTVLLVFVKALERGDWLLLDNVNLCSPSLLDRLNGLLEPQGCLTLNEKGLENDGSLRSISPHPDFRIFLTLDPKNGEISRYTFLHSSIPFMLPIDCI